MAYTALLYIYLYSLRLSLNVVCYISRALLMPMLSTISEATNLFEI
jgi:hypothetical protein